MHIYYSNTNYILWNIIDKSLFIDPKIFSDYRLENRPNNFGYRSRYIIKKSEQKLNNFIGYEIRHIPNIY